MADIELVVKIPEEIYKASQIIDAKYEDVIQIPLEVITNGTPLPKEYGRLVDVGQCDRELFYQQCGGADSLITVKSAFDMLMSLPPIIEADKEQTDGNVD